MNPRLGMRCLRGVCPPSKPSFGFPPALAFCPLCPRPQVFPFPEPIPRPTRLLFSRERVVERQPMCCCIVFLLDLPERTFFMAPGLSQSRFKASTPWLGMVPWTTLLNPRFHTSAIGFHAMRGVPSSPHLARLPTHACRPIDDARVRHRRAKYDAIVVVFRPATLQSSVELHVHLSLPST